ncbi:MAG: cobalamin biosynthesis protein CobD [Clostridium sp.]|nr:cobalamin biosynthesis protein CobD [Clostridium sp.]
MKLTLIALSLGFILDLCFGDPRNFPHIIIYIGKLISKLEKIIRKVLPKDSKGELIGGVILVILVTGISTGITFGILNLAERMNTYFRLAIETFICYQLLATKSLKDESMKVYKSLKKGDLEEARFNVSMIVGRDTKSLTEEGVTKAAVETVAENTSDGIIAPIIFMFLGGATLGVFYKAVNTMDSMVGYKNDKYLYFGRAAAKLDDVLNYIPSRISGYLIILAAFITGMDGKGAYKIFKRDRYNHASPNSAQTESACAGALGVELAGDAYYFGKLYKKKTIGDNLRKIEYEDIRNANKLLYVSAFLGMIIFGLIKVTIILL